MALRSPALGVARDACRSVFGTLGLAGLLLVAAASAALAAPAVVLTSENPADPLAPFQERLKRALAATVSTSALPHQGGPAVFQTILANPSHVAFAQRDALVAFRAANRASGPGLEIYGNVPACPVALIRSNSGFRSYADLVAARREVTTVTVDVGAGDGWTAATFEILRGLDAALAHVRLENRGGARALNRVIAGETDALVVLAYDGAIDPALIKSLAAGTLELAPWFTGHLTRLAALHALPYNAARVDIAGPGLFRSHRDYETMCTTLGVVVNANADRGVSESIARAAVAGQLAHAPQQWFDDALTTVTAVLGRAASEARRAAMAAAEPGMAWFAQWKNAATPAPATPTMRPASNLKDDGQ